MSSLLLENKVDLFEWLEKGSFTQGSLGKALENQRKAAYETLYGLEYPTLKQEEWKYTSVRDLISQKFDYLAPHHIDQAWLEQRITLPDNALRFVFVNGKLDEKLSEQGIDNDELYVQALSRLDAKASEKLLPLWGSLSLDQLNPFNAANSLLSADGLGMIFKRKKKSSRPVFIIYVNDSRSCASLSSLRNLVIAESMAEGSLVEISLSTEGEASFGMVCNEIIAEEGAQLEHLQLQRETPNSAQYTHSVCRQKNDSYYLHFTGNLEGGWLRNNLDLQLHGSNCQGYMQGLYLSKGNMHVDNHTSVEHAEPHSFSSETYKGILADQSKSVFNGKIFVRQAAQKTNAFQQNNNITLSENASIYTKPQLEIWADDVKCSHGATIGALDEAPLFYLRARGIGEQEAQALLLRGFVEECSEPIKNEDLREWLNEQISKYL